MSKKFFNHPAYIGAIAKGDKNNLKKYEKQFKERGFDDSVTWALSIFIAEFIYPRLQRFKELANCSPYGKDKEDWLTLEEWRDIIDKMLLAFKLLKEDRISTLTVDEHQAVNEGLKLFTEYFIDLWW